MSEIFMRSRVGFLIKSISKSGVSIELSSNSLVAFVLLSLPEHEKSQKNSIGPVHKFFTT